MIFCFYSPIPRSCRHFINHPLAPYHLCHRSRSIKSKHNSVYKEEWCQQYEGPECITAHGGRGRHKHPSDWTEHLLRAASLAASHRHAHTHTFPLQVPPPRSHLSFSTRCSSIDDQSPAVVGGCLGVAAKHQHLSRRSPHLVVNPSHRRRQEHEKGVERPAVGKTYAVCLGWAHDRQPP